MPDLNPCTPITYTPERQPSTRMVASDILRRPGVRMGMLLSTLLFLSVWIGTIYLVENTWYALDWVKLYDRSETLYHALDILLYVVDALIIVFCGLPLIPGWIRYMHLAASGTTPPFSIMFYAYANRKAYRRAMLLTLGILWRPVVLLAAFAAVTWLSMLAFSLPGALGYVLMIILALSAAAILIFGSIRIAGVTLAAFLDTNHPTASLRTVFSRSGAMLRGKHIEIWLLALSLLPHVILGILTFGVYMILHTIPLYFTCLQRKFCDISGEHLPVAEVVIPDETK